MADNVYYTAQQLIDEYPQVVTNFNWSAQRLGVFYSGSLINGYRSTKEGGSLLITECSFFDLIEFTNQTLDRRKFEPK